MTSTQSNEVRPAGGVAAAVEVACLGLMIAAGVAAWVVGIFTKGYDYDEVLRAHSIWLTSRGLRPYSDFFEVHPPYFVLLTPVVRGFADPVDALRALRLVAAAGHLLFLGGLVALGMRSLPPEISRRWAWLGLLFVATRPIILDFLVEFRVDGWGYAAIAWGAILHGRRPRGIYRAFEFGAWTALASALFAPKMVLLPPLIALVDQVGRFETWRGFARAGVAYLAGVGVAAGLFALYLAGQGIGIERTLLLLGRYHAVSNAHAGFRYGLLGQVGANQFLLGVVAAGVAGWGLGKRRGRLPGPYEPALALWLAAQVLLVSYPYKQYYAPWFLFASGFVPSIGLLLARLPRGGRAVVYVMACAVSTFGSFQVARAWANGGGARSEDHLIRWMNRVSGPGDRVVGSPPYHPIDRLDTFFLSFNTSDPKGFDSERIFGALPGLRPFATEARYRAELEANPPAVVVLRSPVFEVTHPSTQRAVLEDYLRRKGYRVVRIGVVWLALRPDRFEEARRDGILE